MATTITGTSGHLGLGISPSDIDSIGRSLNIASSTGGAIYLQDTDAPTTKFAAISYSGGTAALQIHAHHSASYIDLGTNGTERLRIDNNGKILIATTTTSEAHANNDELIIGSSSDDANHGLTIVTPSSKYGTVAFSDGSGGKTQGLLEYNHSGDYMRIYTAASERFRIDSNGRIGVNNNSPTEKIDVTGSIQASGGFKTAGHPVVTYASFTDISGGSYATRLGSTGTSTLRSTQIYGGGGHIATFDGVNNRLGINIITPDERLDVRDGDIILSSSNAANAHRTSFIEFTGSYAKIISEAGFGSDGASNYASGWKFTTRNYTGSAFETRNPLQIYANGDVKITDGDLKIGTSGHGIDFGAQTGTSATGATTVDETLDHYEEGTWTPVIRYYSGSWQNATLDTAGTITKAHYTRVGRMVTATFDWSGFQINSGTVSYPEIIGLPFQTNSSGIGVSSFATCLTNEQDQGLWVASTNTTIQFYRSGTHWNSWASVANSRLQVGVQYQCS